MNKLSRVFVENSRLFTHSVAGEGLDGTVKPQPGKKLTSKVVAGTL